MTKDRFATISLRVSPKERRAMKRTAKARGLTLSEWLRTAAWIDVETLASERQAAR